ncbi:hypothetical protein GCM10008107_02380 [Psychrosphaera saromensis]|uniref:VWFA domain-containing protein n=1 Tax=Psychrosphaera saromensis TaxID=716813 RepID=A0A2S7UZ74_9GAMM|nr:VWA domain-containing protein [Psychrosphaera saromensis]PQJ54802.1 hypothetical protein BTO11_14855 [Psychrosphaera saromensis]GHB57000.1 hypothetical protein GCM10008107_02380 [Psychrosphaera saromensis]GLQ13960.1 hypothetical protein GCM10007917_14150 [Psychrosphaera saromensis]
MTDFLAQFSQFHFLRPNWFWVIIPLLIIWLLKLKMVKTTQWHQVIPPHLANAMLGSNKENTVKQKTLLLPLIWLLTIFTLAGPTWQKIEKPVFQIKRASVIVLDMSMSMRATDIKPNRLSKARYKAMDLANAITDGEVALVAYAGAAFTISPLTPDTRNITALIPSLKPEIMPVQGSYPLEGLNKATDLLKQAGYLTGDIYWITDGVEKTDLSDLTTFSQKTPYRINIMTVGTPQGAPIKMLDNSLLKDHLGSIVIPQLNNRDLMTFSNISNGVFVNTTATDADIKTLLAANVTRPREQADTEEGESQDSNSLTGDDWQEFGPYILLFILPLVLVFFRKGATILMMLVLPFCFTPKNVMAADAQPTDQAQAEQSQQQNTAPSWSDYVFKTKDQVGAEHFANEEYEQALTSFESSQWKGSSAYKAGDFETALNNFQLDNSALGLYNQGNALANLGKLDEAIEAYDKSLKIEPDNQNTIANKALLEQMKQQQDQQKQDDGDKQDQDSEKDKSKQDSEQEGEQESEQEKQDSSEKDDSDQDSSKSDSSDKNSSDKNSSDKNSSDKDSSDSKESQSDNQSEPQPSDSENQKTPEQQSEQKSPEQDAAEQESKASEAQAQSEKNQDDTSEEKLSAAQLNQQEIDEQEQQQKIEQLLRKVSDDPATLLRNKMILESRKREHSSRPPAGATKSW